VTTRTAPKSALWGPDADVLQYCPSIAQTTFGVHFLIVDKHRQTVGWIVNRECHRCASLAAAFAASSNHEGDHPVNQPKSGALWKQMALLV